MNGPWQARIRATLIVSAGIAASPALGSATDALSAVQVLREGGCGGVVPASRPLRHDFALDGVAQQWAAGLPLWAAAERSGYPALAASGLFLSASAGPELEQLRRFSCLIVTSLELRAVGVYRRGPDSWIVMLGDSHVTAAPAAVSRIAPPSTNTRPFESPPPFESSPAPTHTPSAAVFAAQALQLVNDVRARGVRCGGRQFAPAPALALSGTLAGVALGHAADMAQHDYFEHRDLNGQSPADRVRAVGYREKLVGENIAYGPKTLEDVVQGWLDSPGHCENIMDPRFAEMGIAYATGQSGRHGLYWVQLFAAPQT